MNPRVTRRFLVVGLLLMAGTVAAQPMGAPMDPPMERPMERSMGRPMDVPMGRWWERPKVAEHLALTPEQTKKLEAITLDQARTMVDLKGAVEKAEIDLRAASDAEPFNAKRVRDAFGVLLQARTKLETQRFDMLLKTREVLTAEQWGKLRQFAHERRMERDVVRERRMEKDKPSPPGGEDPGRGPGGWDE